VPLFNRNKSLRHLLFIFGVPALVLLGLVSSCGTAAHADTGSTEWVRSHVYVADIVVYHDKSGCHMAEIDTAADQYVSHIRWGFGTYCHKAWAKLVNRQINSSYKITLGRSVVFGCTNSHPDCAEGDQYSNGPFAMQWWSGHPGWKIGGVGPGHRVRDIRIRIVEWFRSTCGTNC
jgi:hypothetical protein